MEVEIDVGNSPPIAQIPYRVPLKLHSGVKAELDNLLQAGIIEHSCSNWSSPMVPVVKPDGSVRICIDY